MSHFNITHKAFRNKYFIFIYYLVIMLAGFEVAAQVFSCIGLLVLIAACFLAVFLNFMTQNSAHNRWLEITVFVGGKKRCHVLPLIQIC